VVEDGDVADCEAVTVSVVLHPGAGGFEAKALDQDVAAVFEVDILGSGSVFVSEIRPLAVDCASSSDCDIFEVFARDDRPVAEFAAVGEFSGGAVVGFVFAAEERAAGVELYSDIALEIDGPGEPCSWGQVNRAAAVFGALVDSFLDGVGAERFAAWLGAEIADVADFPAGRRRRRCDQEHY